MPISIQQHDSPMGAWVMAHWSPRALADVLDSLWYFQGTVALPRERVFPDGCVDLIVHLGPAYRQVSRSGTEPFSTCCISGLLLHSNVVEAPGEPCTVIGLRLRPAGAFALLGQPLHELVDLTVDLADLLGSAAHELAARCAEVLQPDERLRVAASWLAERCAQCAPDPAVAWFANRIEQQAGMVSIASLRERTGWSKTRLTTTFQEQIGVTPKRFARIHRFRRALRLVHGESTPLAQIALACGYYDQAHFNAEFRELSGFSPGEFRAASRYPNSVSLAESTSSC